MTGGWPTAGPGELLARYSSWALFIVITSGTLSKDIGPWQQRRETQGSQPPQGASEKYPLWLLERGAGRGGLAPPSTLLHLPLACPPCRLQSQVLMAEGIFLMSLYRRVNVKAFQHKHVFLFLLPDLGIFSLHPRLSAVLWPGLPLICQCFY